MPSDIACRCRHRQHGRWRLVPNASRILTFGAQGCDVADLDLSPQRGFFLADHVKRLVRSRACSVLGCVWMVEHRPLSFPITTQNSAPVW